MFKDQKGAANARELLLAGIIILLAAAVVILVLSLTLGKKSDPEPLDVNSLYPPLENNTQIPGTSGRPQGAADQVVDPEETTIIGTLTAVNNDRLRVTEKGTQAQYIIELSAETDIFYQNSVFSRSNFHAGDQLEITAINDSGTWRARRINVLVSASPTVPAPVPTKVETRPDGSIKPL